MSISFMELLSDCLVALGDTTAVTWSRTTKIWPWCIEAMLAFPILRPMLDDHTVAGSATYTISMPIDFREVISVEYPISQTPISLLRRKSRLDPKFFDDDDYYDIDRDYSAGTGWMLYLSTSVAVGAHVKTQYLANHDTDMADDSSHLITVPDEYEEIIIAAVVAKAYRERLSYYMQDPTAHQAIILEMTQMVRDADAKYQSMVITAQQKLAVSRLAGDRLVDKYDRVY